MLLSIYSTLLHKLIQQLTKLRQLLSVSKMSSLEYCVNQCSPCIFTATYCKITVHCWQLQLPVFYCFLTGQFLTVYEMLERYLEQQAAVFSALTDKTIRRNIKDTVTLSDEDVKLAEDIIQVLKPLKMVTTLLSTEQLPTVSMIMPLKHTILESLKFLHMSTALDPRFKSLPFLDETMRINIFNRLMEKILEYLSQQAQVSEEQLDMASISCDPPAKKAPISELFGKLFPVEPSTPTPKSLSQMVKEEVACYRQVPTLPVELNPLAWWKDNESQFPHVAKLAKCYLGVPATSVPSERVFSTAGDIVTAQRSSLSSENVDIMVFLKKNLKLN
ncbi:E3 SUMO-protein ligase ZBED1 isoform X3 [Danio rerio]|uniref:E3 SUMO-protein ligase ZBED1 isoform X3 n=1 Tax=Danio rerio TaxID=7955 RepID=A0AC58IN71_DANRE